ncbi:MAG: MFS transporter [Gammaproteobacteria bacterium]|nr:MFS transporter [Gammaproteobacteria bacterium]MBS01648.1 MFS transporter [Gammaproteobacteria bacterium]
MLTSLPPVVRGPAPPPAATDRPAMTSPDRPLLSPGWRIIWALFVILAFSSGLGFYNQAVLIRTIPAHTALTVSDLSNATTLFFLVSGVFGLVLARLLERYDIRLVMGVGSFISAGALAAIGFVEGLVPLFGIYILFGLGFSSSGLLPATTLVARWFAERRASALAVASTGLSAGGVLVTPASALLVESVSVSTATSIMGLAYLVGTLPCIALLRSHPPDAEPTQAATAATSEGYRVALRSRYFWCLSIAYLALMACQVGGIAHQYGLIDERGEGGSAALALMVLPVCSIVGRLAGGWIADRFSPRWLALSMMALQAVAMVMLALAEGWVPLLVSLAVFGASVGNLLMLHPLLVADAYGHVHYARLFSISNLMSTLGVAAGPALMGFAYTATGGYWAAFMGAAIASVIATVIYVAGAILKPVDSA